MLIYLVSVGVLLASAQGEDCWKFGLEVHYGEGDEFKDVESFDDCYKRCQDTLGEDCYYTTYIPAEHFCLVGPHDVDLIDRVSTGYIFTDYHCLYKDLAERDACRIDNVLSLYTTDDTYKRSMGTIAECDEFCLGYDWCRATTWWRAGDTGRGYCQTAGNSVQVRSFTAKTTCLKSGNPCATGNVLDPEYGCVKDN